MTGLLKTNISYKWGTANFANSTWWILYVCKMAPNGQAEVTQPLLTLHIMGGGGDSTPPCKMALSGCFWLKTTSDSRVDKFWAVE